MMTKMDALMLTFPSYSAQGYSIDEILVLSEKIRSYVNGTKTSKNDSEEDKPKGTGHIYETGPVA